MTSIFLLEMSDFTAFCRTISKNRKYWKTKKAVLEHSFSSRIEITNRVLIQPFGFYLFSVFYMFPRKTLKFSAATAERTTIMVIVFLDFGTGCKCIDKTVIVLIHMYAVLF